MVNEMVHDGFFDATVCYCVCFKVHFIFNNAVGWLLHIDIGFLMFLLAASVGMLGM